MAIQSMSYNIKRYMADNLYLKPLEHISIYLITAALFTFFLLIIDGLNL